MVCEKVEALTVSAQFNASRDTVKTAGRLALMLLVFLPAIYANPFERHDSSTSTAAAFWEIV
jgi:hypothetical protein